jgi:hypothetical protein
MQTPTGYAATADTLRDRIVALIPDNPHIMDMDDPWSLFGVKGFDCSDLGPSLAQAAFALRAAQQQYRSQTRN